MPIFCVKSVKIYTGQKFFTQVYSWLSWQIWGMDVSVCVKVVSRCEFNLESECVIPDFQLVGALLIPGEFWLFGLIRLLDFGEHFEIDMILITMTIEETSVSKLTLLLIIMILIIWKFWRSAQKWCSAIWRWLLSQTLRKVVELLNSIFNTFSCLLNFLFHNVFFFGKKTKVTRRRTH